MADRMEIGLTVPVHINGCLAFEFEAAVEVEVTYRGCPAQTYGPAEWCHPAEGPEWEVTAYYVDCGSYDIGRKRWRSNLQAAPPWLAEQIDTYLDCRDGQNGLAESILEEMKELA